MINQTPTVIVTNHGKTSIQFIVDGVCTEKRIGWERYLLIESTNLPIPIKVSYPTYEGYQLIKSNTAKEFSELLFLIDGLSPSTKYCFEVRMIHTTRKYHVLKEISESQPYTLQFTTPPESLGWFANNEITEEDLEREKKLFDSFSSQRVKPNFEVMGTQGSGKSTFNTNVCLVFSLKTAEATIRSTVMLRDGNAEHDENSNKGTRGCVFYSTPAYNSSELQGFTASEINKDSDLFKMADLIINGHVSSFDCDPTTKYKEIISEKKVEFRESSAHKSKNYEISSSSFEKESFSKVAHVIFVVIDLYDRKKTDEGIKLFQLLSQKFPSVPKIVVVSKLDIVCNQPKKLDFNLNDGEILYRLSEVEKGCGIHRDYIFPAFPPMTVCGIIPRRVTYLVTKLFNTALLRARTVTQEILSTDFTYYNLNVTHNNETTKILVTKEVYYNYPLLIQKIKEKLNLTDEIYLFQKDGNELREIRNSNEIDFFFDVYIGRKFNLYDLRNAREMQVRTIIEFLPQKISELTNIENLHLFVRKNGNLIRIQEKSSKFEGDVYYCEGEIKTLTFLVQHNFRNGTFNINYVHDDELIDLQMIFEKLGISENTENYRLVASKSGGKVQVLACGDILGSENYIGTQIVLKLEKSDEQILRVKFKRGRIFIPMDIPYKNVSDPISVKLLSDRLPNEDLSKFQILGKFAGEEEFQLIYNIHFALLCEEKNNFKILYLEDI